MRPFCELKVSHTEITPEKYFLEHNVEQRANQY